VIKNLYYIILSYRLEEDIHGTTNTIQNGQSLKKHLQVVVYIGPLLILGSPVFLKLNPNQE